MPDAAAADPRPEFVLSPTEFGGAFVPADLRSDALPCMAFYADHVVIVSTLGDYYNVVELELPLRALGHVELLRPNRIEVVHGFVTRARPGRQGFKVSRLVVEDRFDQVVEHLHQVGHLFSWCDDNGVHYSRPWTLADVKRGGDPIVRVGIEVRSRQPVDMRIDTDCGAWSVVFDAGLIARPQAGTEREMSTAAIQLHQGRFSSPGGLLLGGLFLFHSGAFRLVVEDGFGVVVHPGHRTVYHDGKRIGVIRGQGDAAVEFDQPVPELLGVMLQMALSRPDSLARPFPVAAPASDPVAVGGGFPRRVPALGLGLLFVLWGALSLLSGRRTEWWLLAIPALFVVASAFRRTRDRLVCSELGIDLPAADSGGQLVHLSHFDLGHLEWDGRSGLVVHHASEDRYPTARNMRTLGRDGGVQAMRDAVRRFAPDHVFSMCLGRDGRVQYSRAFEFVDLFPWQGSVRRAELIREPDRMILARTPRHTYVVWGGAGYSLTLPEDAGDTTVGQVLVHVEGGTITLHNGMILGRYSQDLRISLATLPQIHVDAATGAVTVGNGPIGMLRNSTAGLVLETEGEHPEVLLLLILLVFAKAR